MKKNLKVVFALVFIISLILGSKILINRVKEESKNNTYEIGISDSSISNMNDSELKNLYKQMNQEGVKSIIVKNESLYQVSKYRSLQILDLDTFLKKNERYKDTDVFKDKSKNNIVISLDKKDFLKNELDIIESYLSSYKVLNNKDKMIFYIDEKMMINNNGKKVENPILTNKFFINEKRVREIELNKFNAVLGIANVENERNQKLLLNQIKYMARVYGTDQVQLRGQSLLGYPNNIKHYFEELQNEKITVLLTEFQNSIGLTTYSELNKGNITRAHEVNVNELNLNKNELAARISRAIKERNIRFIAIGDFINYKNSGSVESSINDLMYSIKEAKEQIGNKYSIGIAKPVPIMQQHNISIIFICIAFGALLSLTVLSLFEKNLKVSIALFSIVTLVSVFVVKSDIDILIKLYTFSIAIFGAFSAIVIPYKSKLKSFLLKYILSSFIAISAGVIIASIMYGTDYMLKLKSFSGVKFLYVLPPVLITIWVVLSINMGQIKNLKSLKSIKYEIIKKIKKLRLYHLVIGICILAAIYIYVSRSGNGGNASEFELEIRAFMEKILYVRPRTKEFLIGYPALFISYYLYNKNKKISQYILILGSIATMSTVNTFTHLHTPFLYSLLRTMYGVAFGAIIGVLYIFLLNVLIKFIYNKKRI
ncbi:DUF5693 family protein [Paraclostridium sordellii]|uniref:DUF5693 family protein n=1 Tax=Paraclostridium sordellii TaxID=1505 RepID=UPI0005E3BDC2|nr:DUF5693 family protein [Paeniclostridium sordellii]CEP38774.1 Uncharacterised protein [[Clostridium] sordellii] [Paeniclostridium sordellii]